jgi:hypothetical protein
MPTNIVIFSGNSVMCFVGRFHPNSTNSRNSLSGEPKNRNSGRIGLLWLLQSVTSSHSFVVCFQHYFLLYNFFPLICSNIKVNCDQPRADWQIGLLFNTNIYPPYDGEAHACRFDRSMIRYLSPVCIT